MKKVIPIIVVILVIAALFLFQQHKNQEKEKKEGPLIIEQQSNCSNEKNKYYEDASGHIYYTHCLSKITLKKNKEELKDALAKDSGLWKEIISNAYYTVNYQDGGSKEYQWERYKIVSCNTLNGDTSILIGTSDLDTPSICE